MLDKVVIKLKDVDNSITNHIVTHPEFNRHTPVKNSIGSIHGFTIVKNDIHLTIYGSITKFGFGANSHNVDIHSSVRAVKYLIRELCLPDDSKVSKLEIGLNIPVKLSVLTYLNDLAKARRYKNKFESEDDEVTFEKRSRCMRFYDKSEDLIESNVLYAFGEDVKINLFRYELVLGYPCRSDSSRINIVDLTDKAVLKSLILMWHNEFNKIVPNPTPLVNFHPTYPKDVYNHLILKGIEGYGGLENFLRNNVLTFSKDRKINTDRRNNMKANLYSLARSHTLVKPSESYEELRRKITLYTMHLISNL